MSAHECTATCLNSTYNLLDLTQTQHFLVLMFLKYTLMFLAPC